MKYKRVLLKLSGEALMGSQQYGIDPVRLGEYADVPRPMWDDRNQRSDAQAATGQAG